MSRNSSSHTELLPVLRVSIDPWRCAGHLGPTFPNFPSMPGSIVQAGNAFGHAAAKAITGRDKDENMAYNSLIRVTDSIKEMERSGAIDTETMNFQLNEQRKLYNQYVYSRAIRKGQTPPPWATEHSAETMQTIGPPGQRRAPSGQWIAPPSPDLPAMHQTEHDRQAPHPWTPSGQYPIQYPPQPQYATPGQYPGPTPPQGQYPGHSPQPGQYPGHPPQPGQYPGHQPQSRGWSSKTHPSAPPGPLPGQSYNPRQGSHVIPTAVPVTGRPIARTAPFARAYPHPASSSSSHPQAAPGKPTTRRW